MLNSFQDQLSGSRARANFFAGIFQVVSAINEYVLAQDIDLDKEIVLDKLGNRITEKRAREIAETTIRELGEVPTP